jgi:hypothetical protein
MVRAASKRNSAVGWFYVCHRCHHHWPRCAVLFKVTARDGDAPMRKSRKVK